jgi:hypothetical protein
VAPPVSKGPVVSVIAVDFDWLPAADGYDSLESSVAALRLSEFGAGSRVSAPDMFVLANVELAPEAPRGSLPRFSLNQPPARVDSAARLSDATAPAFSSILGAFASLTWGLSH